MKIRIVGGMSLSSQISIVSNEFAATAICSPETGNISCNVRRLSWLSRFLHNSQRFPWPRLLRLALFLFNSLTKRGWVILGFSTFATILLYYYSPAIAEKFHPLMRLLFYYQLVFNTAFLALYLAMASRFVASWHGAEHMVIAAYDRTGSTDLEAIRKEVPVHDKCGGRLLLPSIVASVVAEVIAIFFDLNKALVLIATFEAVLWVDTLIGWHNIPITSHASHVLQKYVTTRMPGERELLTAQRAMKELVAAHKTKRP